MRPARATKADRRDLTVDAATSARLGRIRQHGTAAELAVRHVAYHLGARYRTRNRDLPGSPDMANRARGWAIFVHGCFWHSHSGCPRATVPKRNRSFWVAKFEANRRRDRWAVAALRRRGFLVMALWECEVEKPERLEKRLARFLAQARANLAT